VFDFWWQIEWNQPGKRRHTSLVDVVGENSRSADQYTGDSTGTAHEHEN
jgi:hypothetical protein